MGKFPGIEGEETCVVGDADASLHFGGKVGLCCPMLKYFIGTCKIRAHNMTNA